MFGEIDLRWGILLRRLCVSLDHANLAIEGVMHLHSFLINERELQLPLSQNTETVTDRTIFH